MSKSQKRRNVSPSSGSKGKSTPSTGSASGSAAKRHTGPSTKQAANRAKAMSSARKAAAKGGSNQLMIWVIAAVVVAVLVVVGIIAIVNQSSSKITADDMPKSTLDNGVLVVGEPDAKVVVDYWIDPLCPACRIYEEETLETLVNKVNDGTILLKMHPVAILDRLSQGTAYSTRSSAATLCAASEGKGYQYLNLLYEKQPAENTKGLDDATLIELGGDVDLGADFESCVKDGAMKELVKANTDEFSSLGYPGTPTALVNGKQMTQGTDAELQDEIEAAAKAAA